MKHFLAVLLCLLLCGCGQSVPPALPETEPESTSVPVMAGLYDPSHPMEKAYPGLVRAYPLTLRKVQGIRTFGNDVLVLSGYGNTTLTQFTGGAPGSSQYHPGFPAGAGGSFLADS